MCPNQAQIPFYCGVDVDRKIDLKRFDATVTFWLMGYFTDDEAVFFTNGTDKSPTPANGWRDQDCSAIIPAGGLAAIVEVSHPTGTRAGFRQFGSTDTYQNFTTGKGSFIAALDANRHYESYTSSTTNGKHYVVGYFTAGTFKIDVAGQVDTVRRDLDADRPE